MNHLPIYEHNVHRTVKPSFLGPSTSKPVTSGVKPEASLQNTITVYPAQPKRQVANDKKELDKHLATKEVYTQNFLAIPESKMLERPDSESQAQNTKDAHKSAFAVTTADGVSSTLLNPCVEKNEPAQTTSTDINRTAEEALKSALNLLPPHTTTEKDTTPQTVTTQKSILTRTTSKTVYTERPLRKLRGAGKSLTADDMVTILRDRGQLDILWAFERELEKKKKKSASRAAPNTKNERWQAVTKPKMRWEKVEELKLELDEESWEKVDGDDEWEVVGDPRVEVN